MVVMAIISLANEGSKNKKRKGQVKIIKKLSQSIYNNKEITEKRYEEKK